MVYFSKTNSPLGEMIFIAKDEKLIGLYLTGEFNNLKSLEEKYKDTFIEKNDLDIFIKAQNWLDRYFKGDIVHASEIDLDIKNNILGTKFEKDVWKYIYDIPYGEITTYKEIADKIKKKMNKEHMAAQAVGRAVGRNPISIIVPCHRVVGSKGDLVGFASGLDNKETLLNKEKINLKEIFKSRNKK